MGKSKHGEVQKGQYIDVFFLGAGLDHTLVKFHLLDNTRGLGNTKNGYKDRGSDYAKADADVDTGHDFS